MAFHLLFLFLALALASAGFSIPTATDLPAYGNNTEIEWAAATMSLLGGAFAVGLNGKTGQSLSDDWDLPTGQIFCNDSSDDTIDHNYVTTLINTLYAGKANSGLLRAASGEVWKITHNNKGTLRGTQICKSHPPLLEILRCSFLDEYFAK